MGEDPAEPDGGLEKTTVTVALFLLLWPSYESEEVGPDLVCILPVLTGCMWHWLRTHSLPRRGWGCVQGLQEPPFVASPSILPLQRPAC